MAQAGRPPPPPPPPLLLLSVLLPLTVLLTFEPRSSDVTTVLSLQAHIAQASNYERHTEGTKARQTPTASSRGTQAHMTRIGQSGAGLQAESWDRPRTCTCMQDDGTRPLMRNTNPQTPAHLVSKLAGASASEGTSTACTTAGATAGEISGAAPSGAAAPWSAAAGRQGAERVSNTHRLGLNAACCFRLRTPPSRAV